MTYLAADAGRREEMAAVVGEAAVVGHRIVSAEQADSRFTNDA